MEVLKKPLVTEKASESNDKGKYAFVVDKRANKVEIKKAVEQMYNVNVVSVNTMNYTGKLKTRYTKSAIVSGRKPSYKKAVIQVADGEMIDFYSNI